MALLAHYLCDNQDNGVGSETMPDVSGHANNHDAPLTIFNTANGFDHKRIDVSGNVYSSAEPNNPADFRLQGDMTVCCWVTRICDTVFGAYPTTVGAIMGYGDTTHETQAENFQWQLDIISSARFQLWWEHGAGVDAVAASPANAMDPLGDGWGGQTQFIHIAAIRTVSGTASVKFVVNGVDLGADVTGLTPPDGGTYPEAGPWLFALPRTTNINRAFAHIASLRVYDSAESVANLLSIYNAEKAMYENATKSVVEVAPLAGWQRSGPQGSLYVPRDTGTSLNPSDFPLAGWESERP
jgi:hypothetical protein